MSQNKRADQLRQKGNDAFKEQNYQEAINYYTQALLLEPSNSTLYSNRSGAYCASFYYGEAECDAYAAIRLNPKWVKGYTRLGNALVGEKRWDDALYAFNIAKDIDSEDPKIKDDILLVQKNLKKSKNQPIFFGVPIILEMSKNLKYQNLIENPKILKILRTIQDNPSSAQEFAQDPIIEDLIKQSFQLMHSLDFFDIDTNSAGDGIPTYHHNNQSILEETKKNRNLKNKAKAQNANIALVNKDSGNDAFHEKEYGEAVLLYSMAISNNPTNETFYSNRAAAFTSLELPVPALADSEKAIQIKPSYMKPHIRKAGCYYDLCELMKAYECYLEALALDQENAESKSGINMVIDEVYEISRTVSEDFRKISLEPEVRDALLNMTRCNCLHDLDFKAWTKETIAVYLKIEDFRSAFDVLIQNGVFDAKC